jgi:signal transduction histidine kinase
MSKKGIGLISIGFLLLLLSVAIQYVAPESIEKNLTQLERTLEEYLDLQKLSIEQIHAMIQCVEQSNGRPPIHLCHKNHGQDFRQTTIYHDGKMLYWDQNFIEPLFFDLDSNQKYQLKFIKDQAYISITYDEGPWNIHQITDVNGFAASLSSLSSLHQINFTSTSSQYELKVEQLDQALPISKVTVRRPNWKNTLASFLFLGGFFISILALNIILTPIIKNQWLFVVSYILGVLSFKSIIDLLPSAAIFPDFLSDESIFPSYGWNVSLGDLFVDITLLGIFTLIIINRIQLPTKVPTNNFMRWFSGGLHYLILLSFLLLSAMGINAIITGSQIQIQFERLLQWDQFSLVILGAIVLFVSIIFLLSYFFQQQVTKMAFNFALKMVLLISASLILLPIYLYIDINVHPFAFFIVSYIFVILLDLFSENVSGGLTWPFIWLSIFSGFTALLIFSFSMDRLVEEEQEFLYSLSLSVSDSRNLDSRGFDFAIYKQGIRETYRGDLFPQYYQYPKPEGDKVISFNENGISYQIKALGSGKVGLTAHEKTPLTKPISLYSYLFVLWVLFALILLAINSYVHLLPAEWNYRWSAFPSLRKRIQYYILAVTVGSFLMISLVTYFYYDYSAKNRFKEEVLTNAAKLKDDIESSIASTTGSKDLNDIFLEKLKIHRLNGSLYTLSGKEWISQSNQETAPLMPYASFIKLEQQERGPVLGQEAIFSYVQKMGEKAAIIYLPINAQNNQMLSGIDDLIATLLNVYVFLFVIASGIAVAISNSITAPLKVLSSKLKEIKLGRKNEPLPWSNKDELGELIMDYNRMIQKLEESAEIMAATERESAWREMAKQVAHEIKNPLTPMKLSIQHLQLAMQDDSKSNDALVAKVSKTLIEQIDNLNQIASEFSNFAKMPEPENEAVNLNEIMSNVHDLFRKRDDMDIRLFVPIDDILVFADRNHVMRVMNNLLKNAIQAIPTERRGIINIKLYKEEKNAVIKVQDNGVGIPDSAKHKVFKPNFTSKSSGTGLGLAMCANIIEGFNGKIYFESEVNKGTTFYVIIPLMHMKDNFNERERVIL